jgi:flagellar basal body-associated protein FliL
VQTVQGKGIYAILLGIIAVLTLAVAVLSIFLFVMFNQPGRVPAEASASATAATAEGPKLVPAEELRTWNPFATKDNANAPVLYDLMPSEGHEKSFVQVTLLVKFDVGKKRENEEAYAQLVESDSAAEIKQACSLYFKNLTYEDCKSPDAVPKAQDTLKESFNRIVDESAAKELGIVYKVIIENLLAQ